MLGEFGAQLTRTLIRFLLMEPVGRYIAGAVLVLSSLVTDYDYLDGR
jgi:hypothetical protein